MPSPIRALPPPATTPPVRSARSVLPLLCLAGLTAVLVLPAAGPAAAAAQGWTAAPAGAGRPAFYAEGAAGTVVEDTLSVVNRGGRPVTVRLAATGLRVTFADRGLRVPARTRADVPFTVRVPAGAAPGDRSGAVVVRDAGGRSRSVPVRLRVGGPALSALTVEHLAVHGDRITYDLVNRGTTVLVPRLAVHAQGVFGTLLDRAPRTLPLDLPPGRRLRLSEPWPDRPALDAVRIRLTVTAAGGARDAAGTSARFVPRGAVAAAGGAVAALAALIVVRQRARRTPDGGAVSEDPRSETEPAEVVT
ncbi:hypothetical protein ABZT03_25050 [Streptomyces sp. NPDC005574]|uniref:COG1470 family protein n=1 Tax=Streptomyces sp. NPDC005574 TaxID=3156891 RepID=UPI0033B716CD